nr:class I SAM-dependent methyltransferase [Nocardioides sp. KC13]
MPDDWLNETRESYDTDAAGYAEKVRGLLDGRPYLRAGLATFAEAVRDGGGGPVADVGCGPGYVTRHLHDLGVEAFGIDLSPEMIAIARRDHPDLGFEVGSMTDLPLADGSVGRRTRLLVRHPHPRPGGARGVRGVLAGAAARRAGARRLPCRRPDPALDHRLHRTPDQRRQPPAATRADLSMAARCRVHHRGRAPHASRRRGPRRDRLRPEACFRLIRNEEAYGQSGSLGSSQQTCSGRKDRWRTALSPRKRRPR